MEKKSSLTKTSFKLSKLAKFSISFFFERSTEPNPVSELKQKNAEMLELIQLKSFSVEIALGY